MSQLPLALPVVPTIPLNSTAPRERAPRLQEACWLALRRLCFGGEVPASDFDALSGRRTAARIGELRPVLANRAGRSYAPGVDKPGSDADPIPCREDKATGAAWYTLRPWAIDAAQAMIEEKYR